MRELGVIQDQYDTSNDFERKVLLCFLSQPSEIGYYADDLRPVNLDNPRDFKIYHNAVRDDYLRLVKDMSFQNKELAHITYQSAWELLGIELKKEESLRKDDPYAR